VVGISLATLARLYAVLQPGPRGRRANTLTIGLAEEIARLVQALLSSMVAGVLMTQQLITLRAGQRAEYLADAIAARVASPASMADALDTMVIGSEMERRRRGRARDRLRVTVTHPPDHLRIKMVHGLPGSEASVFLSDAQEKKIRAELARDYARIGSQIDETMRFVR